MWAEGRYLIIWLCFQVNFSPVFSDVWMADVVPKMNVLVSSCVVVPCSFKYPGEKQSRSRIRGIWHKIKDSKTNFIYHPDSTNILENFKGRTKLLGNLGSPEHNCTLEIDEVRDHDNGPFCFRIEIPNVEMYSYSQNCVSFTMMPKPEDPKIVKIDIFEEGTAASLRCFVTHTCPSHPPTITWSHFNSEATQSTRYLDNGIWEVESLLTFTPTEEDDHTKITCSINFHGNKKSEATARLSVKRKSKLTHIIIPIVAVLGSALLFGGICYFMSKKYKRRIQELQSRNENGLWNRMSRMSRR
ncbi:myeloid cell surface antigen CD33-like [Hoplias malabaricus]|uniref:myeloid cell surface antigen CD33-like n=1 Tax=Hoplias malabaricus TaxID=27720 RepID=UPI003463307A